MTDQTMTPEQALTRAQTLVGKLRGKHVAGSLSLDEQMELSLCWQTLRAALSRSAVPAVTDEMALAFHHALSDGSLGQSDVDDIKIGLRRVFESFGAPTPAPAVQDQGEVQRLRSRIAELEAALSRAYDAFGIGEEARQPVVLMTNIENARRRSNCLSRIESILSAEEVCEDGDIDSVSLLRWGDEPDVYEARFRKVLEAQVRTAAPAELVELLDRLSPPGHGIALKGDPTQTFHTGHDVYLAQRVRAWLATHESRLRGEGE